MMSADLSQTLRAAADSPSGPGTAAMPDRVHRQDERLATGRALVRTAVAAAVTVPSTWSISDAGRRLEGSIRSAGFHPHRLDLAQDTGFVAAVDPARHRAAAPPEHRMTPDAAAPGRPAHRPAGHRLRAPPAAAHPAGRAAAKDRNPFPELIGRTGSAGRSPAGRRCRRRWSTYRMTSELSAACGR